jgi:hypothetical protein
MLIEPLRYLLKQVLMSIPNCVGMAAALVLAETRLNRIFRVAPTQTNLNAPWAAEVIAGNGKAGSPKVDGRATDRPVEACCLAVDETGTLWYASLNANQISRIDRIRK